jgi:hypothetical protein
MCLESETRELSPAEEAELEKANEAVSRASELRERSYAIEAAERYKPHEDALKKLRERHKTGFYGIAGDSDNKFIYDAMPSCTWLVRGQPLLSEQILGVSNVQCRREDCAGPRLRYKIESDDCPVLERSAVWKQYKDAVVRAAVAHRPALQKGESTPSSAGLDKIINDQRALLYAGHQLETAVIYKHTTRSLILVPGSEAMILCQRDIRGVQRLDVIALNEFGMGQWSRSACTRFASAVQMPTDVQVYQPDKQGSDQLRQFTTT